MNIKISELEMELIRKDAEIRRLSTRVSVEGRASLDAIARVEHMLSSATDFIDPEAANKDALLARIKDAYKELETLKHQLLGK